jgi:hypothetical protein
MPGSFFQRISAAAKVYSHTNQLPPTFNAGEKGNFTQFIPDPTNAAITQYHIDQANKAAAELEKLSK